MKPLKTTPQNKTSNGWTAERRARQSQAIHRWKPWRQSTGAKTPEGKMVVSQNAFKGGQRAKIQALNKEIRQALKEQKMMLDEINS